ncbi:MAG: ribosomal-protein-alanine N-acetyltransferase, partial [Alphaproteobacteria bacterium]|nr:ribosomal-protein-alanine N-acetyltransferase [Alphaproteobacteria bacterium]
FCASPSLRRVKIGLSPLTHAFADGRAKNARCYFLEVASDNTPALRLYKKSGFREVGLRPGYYARKKGAVDAVLMALDL